ncbi:S8 family serine peptidase [Streptomyces sp. NPDC093586]|uniref:S8 family peptidase n=1 Tax=Streptomyces sp. NPDC093586 TaxID=3366042 RepID=UPI003829DF78
MTWTRAAVAACAVLAITAVVIPNAASAPIVHGEIRAGNAPDGIDGRYIVVLEDSAHDRGHQQVTTIAHALTQRYGGKAHRKFSTALDGFTLSAATDQAQRLAADPAVAYVEQDRLVHGDTTQNDAAWGLDRVDQRSLPLSTTYSYARTGSGVTAYIIDSGIRISHQDFGGRASYGYDFVDNDSSASDCHGHGTHVAGTVGSRTYGVAKEVSLVAVRVLNCENSGTSSDVIAGYDWVAQHANRPAVANVSIGGSPSFAKDDAVKGMIRAGVTVAVSAGNNDTSACEQSPARLPEAITVAATTSSDARWSSSNYGSCVDIFAPGSSVRSLSSSSDTGTATMTGTSMATPHVTGAAALYLSRNASASPAQTTSALMSEATTGKVTNTSGSPNRLLYTPSL